MKYFKLMTSIGEFNAGTIFLFHAKHAMMAQLSFQEQRHVLWETVEKPRTRDELAKQIEEQGYKSYGTANH